MSLRDPEVCICNVVNGGDPCSSSRCIRLPSWDECMRDLENRALGAYWLPPADIGPIDIPPRPPEDRAGIFGRAAAQPAQVFPPAANPVWEKAAQDWMNEAACSFTVPPARTGTANTVHWNGSLVPTGGGGGGSSSSASIPICVPERADPVAYSSGGIIAPVTPKPPREPSWQDHRKTWLETGDMSALTAMDQYDPARMSGDDWLDCDEYDVKRTPVPEVPLSPASRSYRLNTAMALAVLLAWLLAVLIVHGVI